MSFARAKEIAQGLLSDVVRGEKTLSQRGRHARKLFSVSDLADQYLTSQTIPTKRPKSIDNDEAALKRFTLS
jgi:hypothetical protein